MGSCGSYIGRGRLRLRIWEEMNETFFLKIRYHYRFKIDTEKSSRSFIFIAAIDLKGQGNFTNPFSNSEIKGQTITFPELEEFISHHRKLTPLPFLPVLFKARCYWTTFRSKHQNIIPTAVPVALHTPSTPITTVSRVTYTMEPRPQHCVASACGTGSSVRLASLLRFEVCSV